MHRHLTMGSDIMGINALSVLGVTKIGTMKKAPVAKKRPYKAKSQAGHYRQLKPLNGGVMIRFKDKNIPFSITDGALKCEDIKDEYNFNACTPSYKNI